MNNPQAKLSRRRFLLAIGAGSASATVAIVAGKDGTPQVKPEPATRPGQGYRLTEHIRNYYRTTKV